MIDWMEEIPLPDRHERKKRSDRVRNWRNRKLAMHRTRRGRGCVGRLIDRDRKRDRKRRKR